MRTLSSERYDDRIRSLALDLLRIDTTDGTERPAQRRFEEALVDAGAAEIVRWEAAPEHFESDPAFGDIDTLDLTDRPNVAGVFEFGDPEAGKTLVLNGHMDVVPINEASWDTDPFDPTWDGERLYARGAADMKSGLAGLLYAVVAFRERHGDDIDGRIVVESVVGEETGGVGTKAAVEDSPYDFQRDGVIIAEPTELGMVTATEGSLMVTVTVEGRSAHAATRWEGESVLPHFETIRQAFLALESERNEQVTHPLYETSPIAWPVNFGIVEAGSWASSVPAHLESDVRIGVAPGETIDAVERAFRERLQTVVDQSDWLQSHSPTMERRDIQFIPAEVEQDVPVVQALQRSLNSYGLDSSPQGATYGADSRLFVENGIPAVVFGPGSVDRAHFPNEYIDWDEVLESIAIVAEAAHEFLTP
jgi:acetylornithine deacetylase